MKEKKGKLGITLSYRLLGMYQTWEQKFNYKSHCLFLSQHSWFCLIAESTSLKSFTNNWIETWTLQLNMNDSIHPVSFLGLKLLYHFLTVVPPLATHFLARHLRGLHNSYTHMHTVHYCQDKTFYNWEEIEIRRKRDRSLMQCRKFGVHKK